MKMTEYEFTLIKRIYPISLIEQEYKRISHMTKLQAIRWLSKCKIDEKWDKDNHLIEKPKLKKPAIDLNDV